MERGRKMDSQNNKVYQTKYNISFNHKYSKVRIYTSIIRALGDPPFIQILIQPSEKKLYIVGLEKREFDSFPVPNETILKRNGFNLHGKKFIRRISQIAGWDDLEKTHTLTGIFNDETKFMEFDLTKEALSDA